MALPIADANPTRRTPVVTLLLIAANLAVFVGLQPWQADGCTQQAFFLDWAAVPDEIVTGEPLNQAEVSASTEPVCGLRARPGKPVHATVLTAMFLHAGWGHLLGNMLFLWVFGNNVEDRLGRRRFLLFYLLCGVLATLAFVFVDRSLSTLVGASGAIAGVLGAYLVMFPRARVTVLILPFFFIPLPALVVLGGWFVLQLFSGRVADMSGGGVAYLAHIAGFVVGAVLVLAYRPRRPAPRPIPPAQPPRGWR